MTNAMIVLMESVRLMEEGVLSGTGKKFKTDDGKEFELPEPIHTYQTWKKKGYQVKKGEKAIAQFPIWKYTTKKDSEMSEDEAQENGFCFMKNSSWFKFSQVEEIKNES